MRGRQRHFNARDAGAGWVLDSRFVPGVALTDPISTWPDRSRNGYDATASSTARPTLQISAVGVPVVRTDGINDLMTIPAGPVINSGAAHTLLVIVKQNSFPSGAPVILTLKTNHTNNWVAIYASIAGYRWISFGSATEFNRRRWDVTADSTPKLLTITYNGSGAGTAGNHGLQAGGVTQTLGDSGEFSGASGPAEIAAYGGAAFGANDYSQIVLINAAVSSALLKRIQRAAAFSHKIPCQ